MGFTFWFRTFFIPGVGPLVVAGTFLSAIIATLEGAAIVGGVSALGAALLSIEIPHDSVVQYETEIKAGNYVMLVHGTAQDIYKAREIVERTGAKNFSKFDSVNKVALNIN